MEAQRGNLKEGDRLPTIRELADHFNINPNTVAKAYRDLDLKGVIASRRGDGSFLAAGNGPTPALSKETLDAKCDELLDRMFAETRAVGITEQEILQLINQRKKTNERK